MLQLRFYEELRFYACNFASGLQDAFRDFPHQTASGSAIDQCVSALSDPCSQFPDGSLQRRILALKRAEVYRNIHVCVPSFPPAADSVPPMRPLYHISPRFSRGLRQPLRGSLSGQPGTPVSPKGHRNCRINAGSEEEKAASMKKT